MVWRLFLVCDSNIRHHSKRATCNWQVEKYKKKIELNNTDSKKEKKNLKKEEEKISKRTTRLENELENVNVDIGNNLFTALLEEVENWKKIHPKSNIVVLQAEFQADSVIAYRTMQQLNDMVFMYDSDLAALCGK